MAKVAPAVLLGLSYTSLAIAGSLGRKGVPVFGVDRDRDRIGTRSRYIKVLGFPTDDKELLDILLEFSSRHDSKSVLFPVDDEYLLFLSRNKDRLGQRFLFPYPNRWSLERLVSKEGMAAIFTELGISMPHNVVLKHGGTGELENFKLEFPIVIKPNLHERWLGDQEVIRNIGRRKVLLIDDLLSLKKYYGVLGKYDTILAQEFIPGKTDTLYYFVGYRNIKRQLLVSFVGRKLRTYPDMFGSECFLQSVHLPDLCRLGGEILDRLDYVGPAGIDFKFDVRDRSYKVIEINCRMGISDNILITCGVDLPYIYYRDVQGYQTSPEMGYRSNVYWCWLEKEIEWFREYGSHDGFTKRGWFKHFMSNKYSFLAVSADDLGPFFYVSAGLVKRSLKKLATWSG